MNGLRVFAPASVSNLACGFDTLGFAIGGLDGLDGLGDEITVTPTTESDNQGDRPQVNITAISGEQGRLPREPSRNTAAVAAEAVLERFRKHSGQAVSVDLAIKKCMPLSSGLGSSAASAVGGAVAAHELLRQNHGFSLSDPELLECALAGELVASGGRHADNVAPSLLGGLVLVRSLDGAPDIVRLPDCSDWLWCALARPHIAIDTFASRQRLGDSVPLPAAIRQWANLGALVAAIYERDPDLLARTLVDHVAEPTRREDVAGFEEAMAAACRVGALGGSLSGSGPTLFALTTSQECAEDTAEAMACALREAGHDQCTALVSTVGARGARVLGI